LFLFAKQDNPNQPNRRSTVQNKVDRPKTKQADQLGWEAVSAKFPVTGTFAILARPTFDNSTQLKSNVALLKVANKCIATVTIIGILQLNCGCKYCSLSNIYISNLSANFPVTRTFAVFA
jgi:hypothetical protein